MFSTDLSTEKLHAPFDHIISFAMTKHILEYGNTFLVQTNLFHHLYTCTYYKCDVLSVLLTRQDSPVDIYVFVFSWHSLKVCLLYYMQSWSGIWYIYEHYSQITYLDDKVVQKYHSNTAETHSWVPFLGV